MRRASSVVVWGLALIAEALLIYDILLVNMQIPTMFAIEPTAGCVDFSGAFDALGNPQSCAPLLPLPTFTVPAAGPLFSNGLLVLLLAVLLGLPVWIAGPILARRRGGSAGAALLSSSVPASLFAALCLISLMVRYRALTATETCFWQPYISGPVADPACTTGWPAVMLALVSVASLPLLATWFLTVPVWVMALVETSLRRQWRWLVAVLFLSPLAATLYGLFGGSGKGAQHPAPTTAAGPSPG